MEIFSLTMIASISASSIGGLVQYRFGMSKNSSKSAAGKPFVDDGEEDEEEEGFDACCCCWEDDVDDCCCCLGEERLPNDLKS